MSLTVEEFDPWLCGQLRKLDLDEDVFCGYVTGLMDSAEDADDQVDTLVDILGEATSVPVRDACREIVDTWRKTTSLELAKKEAEQKAEQEARTSALISTASASNSSASGNNTRAARKAELTEEDRLRKQAVLAQFAYESEDDDEQEEHAPERQASQASRIDATLMKMSNTNRDGVASAQRAERERQQKDHADKIAQSKQAREKQLTQQQERKEKAKAKVQKQERRR